MILLHDNAFDGAAKTYSREVATLPGSNSADPHLSRVWRASGTDAFHVLVDFGAATAIRAFAILGANLSPSATVQVTADAADPAVAAPDFTADELTGMEAGYGALYQVFAADQTYRYWKIAVADAAPLAGYFDIGRIVLGPAWKPARNPSWGAQWTWADESRRTRSRGGQSYTDIGARYRVVEFELGYLDEAEAFGPAFEIDRVAGLSGDVLAIADEDASLLAHRAVWGQIEQATPLVLQRAGKVVKRYRITERK